MSLYVTDYAHLHKSLKSSVISVTNKTTVRNKYLVIGMYALYNVQLINE